MDCGYKRKLDSIVDNMEVLVHERISDPSKRVKLSFELDSGYSVEFDDLCSHQFTDSEGSWSTRRSVIPPNQNGGYMDFDSDSKSINGSCRDDDTYEDLPSTSEVINSLRKVILWMSAQGDHNSDYIQYLGEVERYAKSKQLDITQQRKITEYFLKQNQP